MKLFVVAGNHPRHRKFVEEILVASQDSEIHVLAMERETLSLQSAPSLQSHSLHEQNLLDRHFHERNQAEAIAFGTEFLNSESVSGYSSFHTCTKAALNLKLAHLLDRVRPDGLVAIGPGMFSHETLTQFPNKAINIHLGLSPRYRGSATLFWPSFFLEPWQSGVTFHQFDLNPDSGPIVHQSAPLLGPEMSVHDTAIASIKSGVDAVSDVLSYLAEVDKLEGKRQGVGKTFLVKDFQPRHLVPIYDLFGGKVLQFLMDSGLSTIPSPNLQTVIRRSN